MKKIYTKTVFEFNKESNRYQVNQQESEFYLLPDNAPCTYMKGAGETFQAPMIRKGLNQAEDAFLNTPDFSPESQETQQMIMNQGRLGAGISGDANQQLQKTINGEYLTGGKGFDAALEAAKNKILPSVNSSFEKSGRGGSGLADVAKTGAISDAFAGQYAQERQNQLSATNNAIQNQNNNLNAMNTVGSTKDNARRNAIMNYLKTIGANYGNITEPDEMDQLLKSILAGAGGAAKGYSTTGSPWGAAAGGAAGVAGSF